MAAGIAFFFARTHRYVALTLLTISASLTAASSTFPIEIRYSMNSSEFSGQSYNNIHTYIHTYVHTQVTRAVNDKCVLEDY